MELLFRSHNVRVDFAANRMSSHRGFKLEYKMKDCNGNYTAPFGRIIGSQRYEDRDITCQVLIQVPQTNKTISLYFNAFSCIGAEFSDSSNKMIVYDGASEQATELVSFCAPRRPDPIFSSGPALLLKFVTLRLGRYDITYTSTDQGKGCGGTFQDTAGSFSSPLYPASYKKDSSCRWDVSVPHGNKIYFYFINYDIGQTHTCDSNYIQFFDIDTNTEAETLHSRYCGNEKPAQIQMNGDTAMVRYVTTIHNNGTGWFLRWFSEPT